MRIHPLCDTPMLLSSQRCQFTPVTTGILPYFLQTFLDTLSQFGKIGVIGELGIYPFITAVGWQPARAMSSVMRDVEWFKTRGNSGERIIGCMVSVVYTAFSILRILSRYRTTKYQQ